MTNTQKTAQEWARNWLICHDLHENTEEALTRFFQSAMDQEYARGRLSALRDAGLDLVDMVTWESLIKDYYGFPQLYNEKGEVWPISKRNLPITKESK